MTINCQNALSDLCSTKSSKDLLDKQVIQLKCTLERKDAEIKELKIEVDNHSEIMKKVCPSGRDSQENTNDQDQAGEEIESLRNQLAACNKIRDELKRSHAASINQKNAEIRSLKTAITVLEDNGKEVNAKNDKLQEKLNISKVEVDRAKDINDLLVKKAKNEGQSNGQSSKQQKALKHGGGEINQGVGQAKEAEKGIPACNDVGKDTGSSGFETPNIVPTIPCLEMFVRGECDIEGCNRKHKMNLKKVKRGICVYEFAAGGSCPWKQNCMYTHDIPPEKLSDKKVIQDQRRKKADLDSKTKRSSRQNQNEGHRDKGKDDENKESSSHGMKQQMLLTPQLQKQKQQKQLQKHSNETQETQKVSGDSYHNRNIYEDSNDGKNRTGKTASKHGREQGSVSARVRNNNAKNDYNNDQIKEQNAFLCLIKPMIMDQMKIFVQDCIKEQMEEVKSVVSNVVSGQLTLI